MFNREYAGFVEISGLCSLKYLYTTFNMLMQDEFVAGCYEWYSENGISPGDPDEGNWEIAHYPRPKGEGEETILLLHDHHQVQGLLQTKEEGRKCFFNGDAKGFLERTSFIAGYFDLWDVYEKYAGGHHNLGKTCYRNPENGETALLTPEEANRRGWVHVAKGLAAYKNPVSGEIVALSPDDALERGWNHMFAGRATYLNPESGEATSLNIEEAKERGWVSINSGKSLFRDPSTGQTAYLTQDEAIQLGMVGVNKGKKYPKVVCPHCAKKVAETTKNRWHFDNCRHREGSWRWFVAELRDWSKSL